MSKASPLSKNVFLLKRRAKIAVLSIGSVAIALGSAVLIGWYVHLTALIQIYPTLAPMQFNTALCILLSGAGLCAFAFGRTRAAQALGGIVAVAGALTLFEYCFKVNLGLDQLLFKPYVETRTSNAGRMSPLSAINIFLIGVALILAGLGSTLKWRALILGSLASIIMAFCAMAVLGYITGLTGTYGWGQLTRMGLHTAIGLGSLGLGLFIIAWNVGEVSPDEAPSWLPVPIVLGALTTTLILWQALEVKQDEAIAQAALATATDLSNQIAIRMDGRLKAMSRMARHWAFSRPTQAAWEDDAAADVHDMPGFQAIEWADDTYLTRWIVPLQGNESKLNLSVVREERRRDAAMAAREQHVVVVTRPIDLFRGGRGFIAYAPIFSGTNFDGFIVGIFKASEYFDAVLPKTTAPDYSISIFDGAEKLFERNPYPRPAVQDWQVDKPVALNGSMWTVSVWPTPRLIAMQRSGLPDVILITGILSSLLLALMVYFAQEARARARELQASIAEVKTLSGLLPICGSCKKVRDDGGYWNQIESYISRHSDASFSHGLCPECLMKQLEASGIAVSEKIRNAADQQRQNKS